jgi:hypothetical protein
MKPNPGEMGYLEYMPKTLGGLLKRLQDIRKVRNNEMRRGATDKTLMVACDMEAKGISETLEALQSLFGEHDQELIKKAGI